MTSMNRSDIDKMFAEFPSPYLDEHEHEVWRQQALAYAASIEDWANKYCYYRFYPNGMAIPDTFEGFTQMLSGTPPREISSKLEFADFSHALQSLKQIKQFKSCAKNFLQIFLAHLFYKWGANVDKVLTSSEMYAIFPLLVNSTKDNSPMNISMQSFKVGNGLFVNEYEIIKAVETKKVKMPVHNVFCCDISGSMWDELPLMRKQLKNRLVDIIDEQDTITIIAFAGTNDCFILKEKVHCNNPTELSDLHKAIDKYLQPMGCTDFLQPVKKSMDVVKEDGYYNWVFLSDGGHNCGAFSRVMEELNKLAPHVNQSTIIEYGYYADSDRLSEMAEALGGTKMPASDFDHYKPIIESVFNGNAVSPKIEVELPFNAKAKLTRQFAVYINTATNNVHVSAIDENNKVQLPTSITKFYTVSRAAIGTLNKGKPSDDKALYGIAYVLADKLDYDAVEDVLNATGDKKFIEMYQSSFGKQKLFAFQNELGAAIGDASKRGEIDPNYKPNTDPFCVIDFFNEIAEEENLIRICSDKFSYNRTGAKTVDKVELTEEEQQKLAKAKTASEVQKIMDAAKERQVKMERIDKGYPLNAFVWNEERANLGGLFQIDVKLTLPKNNVGLTTVDSFIWRNYTIIKDGIVNMPVLPMIVTRNTYSKLLKHPALVLSDVSDEDKNGMREVTIDISKLPVINKKKIKGCKKSVMTNLALQLTDCKFTLNYLKKQLTKDENAPASLFAQYSQEQADYLASLGITEKGYSPAKVVEPDGDFYMATTLNSAFKGFSKVPSAADIEKKHKAGKALTAAEQYMEGVIKRVEDFIKKAGGNREDVVKAMIEQVNAEKNQYQRDIAQMKFAMLVSRKWFADSESFDDNVDTVHSNYGVDLVMEYRFGDKKVNL